MGAQKWVLKDGGPEGGAQKGGSLEGWEPEGWWGQTQKKFQQGGGRAELGGEGGPEKMDFASLFLFLFFFPFLVLVLVPGDTGDPGDPGDLSDPGDPGWSGWSGCDPGDQERRRSLDFGGIGDSSQNYEADPERIAQQER